MIVGSLRGTKSDIVTENLYRSASPEVTKASTIRISDILKKYSSKYNCLLVGDWNEIASKTSMRFLSKGVQVYTTDAPTKGRRTKRPIDYGLSNSPTVIEYQRTCYSWMISDHIPVEVSIKHVQKIVKDSRLMFDRKKCNKE